MGTLIWDFWANKYESLWVQKYSLKPTREQTINEILTLKENAQVLDIGCGVGELINAAIKSRPDLRLTGMDFSKKMLEISKDKNKNVEHIHLNADKLSNVNRTYDCVVCTHSLPYYKDQEKIINEIANLLSKNGRLIIAFASANSIFDKIALSLVKLTTGRAKYPSKASFESMIEEGFIIKECIIIKKRVYMPTILFYSLRKKP